MDVVGGMEGDGDMDGDMVGGLDGDGDVVGDVVGDVGLVVGGWVVGGGVLTSAPRTHNCRLLLAIRSCASLHDTTAPVATLRNVIAKLRVVGAPPAS